MDDQALQLKKVFESLEKVSSEINEEVKEMALAMSKNEIVTLFNQHANDLFTALLRITMSKNVENEYNVNGQKNLFEKSLKINKQLPLDKFTFIILEFAADIYDGNEEKFLAMDIPDKKVNVNNEFGMIRSEKFKELWKTLASADKIILRDITTSLTTYAHAFFFKSAFEVM